jgi:hypothetical protein
MNFKCALKGYMASMKSHMFKLNLRGFGNKAIQNWPHQNPSVLDFNFFPAAATAEEPKRFAFGSGSCSPLHSPAKAAATRVRTLHRDSE